MSLRVYRKKRKFHRTPEPRGSKQPTVGPLRFVVQKHQSRSLHYDFRLELDGVLKSWAIPKGPSMSPKDKRLAIMVEDHPNLYAKFEGIIPKGNYGAGTVMIWDKGAYTPLETVDRHKGETLLRKQLEKGHLTFVLLGERLKGEFALIKTPNVSSKAWLLIKKGDEYASTKDILNEDHSVVTGRTITEIKTEAVKKSQVWYNQPKINLNDTPKGTPPQSIKPMLAQTRDEPFDDPDWLFELKWDGYRAIAAIQSGNVALYSRNEQSFKERFAAVAESLAQFPGDAVLDGEIVVVDANGHPSFQLLQDYPQAKKGTLLYYVFDILYYNGHNLQGLPLKKRKEILKRVLPSLPHVRFSEYILKTGTAFFAQANKLGLEGIIAKNALSSYHEGVRSSQWLKVKTHRRQEAIIAGFTSPRGGRSHFGALVLGVYNRGKLRYIGHTGGGFTDKSLEATMKKLKPLIQKKCPFDEVPKTNAPVTWVRPELICEVTFKEWTHEHIMRHPTFLGLRDDKNPKKVGQETLSVKNEPHKMNAIEARVGKQKMNLTNLNKVFWPKEKYTKGDLMAYYHDIASVILPYLKDRPESLLRYPNGITGESFYQKDTKNLNAPWIKQVSVRSESENKTIEYLTCQDKPTLIYMINLGCIDFNPWNSRVGHLDNPDYVIIDLDPQTSFDNVIKVALIAREVFEELDIESYCKTSGARGLHIYIPMGAKYTYDQARTFAELLCVQIQNRNPELISLKHSPSQRKGQVYLDYLRNSRGQTTASAYSVRAQPHASVSAPLQWEEVTKHLRPEQFTMKNMRKRLDRHGDLFKGVLGKGVDLEKVLKKLEQQF